MKKQSILSEREYWFWYCSLYQIPVYIREKLLEEIGCVTEIYHAGEKTLREIFAGGGWTNRKEKMVKRIMDSRNEEKIQKAYKFMEEKKIRLVIMEDEEYPLRLRWLSDRPVGLFVKGRLPEENRPTAAIVGARNCSFYGRNMAEKLGRKLAEAGIQVISGLARGIDAAGHRGALEAGQETGSTYGILGCGADVIYPKENEGLYAEVGIRGGLISEYPPGTRPFAANFPARNRIISGLSDCIIVVEARKKSGSLITASYALDQGKEIWAVPGRAGDYLSDGTNGLLKDGAQLLTEPEDILQFWDLEKKKLKISDKNQLLLDKNWERVYSCVDSEPKSIEEICAESGLEQRQLAECLVDLEMEGLIMQPYRHYYAAKRNEGEHYGKVSGYRRVPRESKDN